jgi:putative ABC transport system permease protein
LREVRRRPLRTGLAVVAVGGGVALVVGVAISITSLHRSIDSYTAELGGRATLRVQGPIDHGGLDGSVLAKVAAVPGVRRAVPMVLAVTEAIDEDGHRSLVPAIGVDCSFEGVLGPGRCTPGLLRALGHRPVIGPALRDRVGRGGTLRTDLGSIPLGTAPTLGPLGSINGGVVAVFDLREAQRAFARPDGLDAIFVVPSRGVDHDEIRARVAQAAGPWNQVLDSRSPITRSEVAGIILPFLLLISVIGLLIGAQLVRSAIELSLEERRRELATAAALGATPRRMLMGVLAEGAAIGALGGVVGIALGLLVANAFVGSLSHQVERATGLHIPVALSGWNVALALAVGVAVCLVASLVPGWRATRRELTVELSERGRYDAPATRRPRLWRTAFGLVACVAVAWPAHRHGVLERWQPPVLWASMVVATLLAFRLPPLLVRPLLARLRGRGPFATGSTRVALDNLLSTPKRTASIAAAVGAPVVMAVMVGSIVPSIHEGARRIAEQSSAGGVYVSTSGAIIEGETDAKPTRSVERRIAALPGVARIDHWYYSVVDHPSTHVREIDGIDGAVPRFTRYDGLDGPTAVAKGWAMVAPTLARDDHLRKGSTLVVPGRYGEVRLKVGGVWADTNGIGRGIVVSAAVLRQITGPRPPDRLIAVPAPGVSATELAARIRAARLDRRLIVKDPTELADYLGDEFAATASPFWAMQRGILLVTLVATASALLLVAIQRRRELAVLAALGMGPRDLARSTVVETVLLGTTAALVASIGTQVSLVIFTWASGLMTALNIPYTAQPIGAVIASSSAVAVALLGAAIPAWRATRADPVLALREA